MIEFNQLESILISHVPTLIITVLTLIIIIGVFHFNMYIINEFGDGFFPTIKEKITSILVLIIINVLTILLCICPYNLYNEVENNKNTYFKYKLFKEIKKEEIKNMPYSQINDEWIKFYYGDSYKK